MKYNSGAVYEPPVRGVFYKPNPLLKPGPNINWLLPYQMCYIVGFLVKPISSSLSDFISSCYSFLTLYGFTFHAWRSLENCHKGLELWLSMDSLSMHGEVWFEVVEMSRMYRFNHYLKMTVDLLLKLVRQFGGDNKKYM